MAQFQVERYSQVMHIGSEVQGRLRDGLDALDAYAAGFPAGTLTGIAKRGLKGVATFALKTPEDLEGALAFVADHGAAALPQQSGEPTLPQTQGA